MAKLTTWICDECGKEHIGELPEAEGWVYIGELRIFFDGEARETLEDMQFCSSECLADYINKAAEREEMGE